MVYSQEKIKSLLSDYSDISVATICSHSSLQIFKGAREEGLHTIGIVTKEKKKLYESFPYGKPDEFIVVDSYREMFDTEQLLEKNAIIIPHGSFVEYLGEKVDSMPVPIYGNRRSLEWERSREKMLEWLSKSGLKTPKSYKPSQIDGPVLVKFPGAKGGHGYTIVKSEEEFHQTVGKRECLIQEFIVGVRAYPHYFFSPISNIGYKTKHGNLELMGVDTRVESSADEIARAVSAGVPTKMTFTVVGNTPLVLRESLLHEYMEMAEKVSETSFKLFGGIFGPYCIETIITEDLEIFAFEVSARIVAGTNMFIRGSPYSTFYYDESMSMGRRIARELKDAAKKKKLGEICY